jgi:hypothetical protein
LTSAAETQDPVARAVTAVEVVEEGMGIHYPNPPLIADVVPVMVQRAALVETEGQGA